MFGVSVYLSTLDLDELEKHLQSGVSLIFTSLHIPEEDLLDVEDTIKSVLAVCQRYHATLIPDISTQTFKSLGLEIDDFESLKELGFSRIRLDYGYDNVESIERLIKDFELDLNASTMTDELFVELKALDVDRSKITLSHNFYPKAGTALSYDVFKERNKRYHEQGFRVQSFISGDINLRGPVYKGLPTVEQERGLNPLENTIRHINHAYVDDVIIGDSGISEYYASAIHAFMSSNEVMLKVTLDDDYEYLYGESLKLRRDVGDTLLRLNVLRTPKIPVRRTIAAQRGFITMDNERSGRYSGEIQLVKQDLPLDPGVNVIGTINLEEIGIMDILKGSETIVFRK